MAPVGTPTSVDPLEVETSECIQELKTAGRLRAPYLLGLLDKNGVACEVLNQRVKDLDEQLRELLRATDGGTWKHPSDDGFALLKEAILKELLPAARPPSEPVQQVIHRGSCVLTDLDGLESRVKMLRGTWPELQDSVRRARDLKAPLATSRLLAIFQEALLWRRRAAWLCSNGDRVCRDLQEILDSRATRQGHKQRWKERWKALSRDLTTGSGEVSSVRIGAVFWLRTFRITETVDPQRGAEVLASQIQLAQALERRLTKCAGMAMRVETDLDKLRPVVRRMTTLKTRLLAAIKDAEEARHMLLESEWDSLRDTQEAANAVNRLMQATDDADFLFGCPVPAGETGSRERPVASRDELVLALQRASGQTAAHAPQHMPRLLLEDVQWQDKPPMAEDVAEFRAWLSGVSPSLPGSGEGKRSAHEEGDG